MRINSELMIYTARGMTVMTAPTAFLTLMGWTTALRTTLTEESMAGPLAATGVCLALTLAAAGVAAAAYLGGTRLRALEDRLLQEWAGLAPTWGNARWTLDRSGRHSNLRVTVPDGPGREELRWQARVRQETDGTVRIERPELQGHRRTRGWISVPTEDTRPYPRRTGANGLRQECRGVIADCCRATLAAARVDALTEKNRTDSEFILQRMADSGIPGSQPVQSGPLRKKQRFAERKPEPVPKPLDTYTSWRQRVED